MKKIVAVVLGLVLLLSMASCFAEEEPFYPGTYHVGKDFRAGGYNIHVKKTGSSQPVVYIQIYQDEEAFKNGKSIVYQSFRSEGYHLSVSDGMVFELQLYRNGSLMIVNETPSWMIVND